MKIFLFLVTVLTFNMAYAYDTYFFKVDIDSVRRKANVDALFQGKGRLDSGNPFFNLFVYPQSDTSCVIVQLTPANATEDTQAQLNFSLPFIHLRKQFYVEENQEPQVIVDNTETFSITDWSLEPSLRIPH